MRLATASPAPAAGANRLSPLRFIVAFGVVSLLADFVYEGARSVVGPYLATLGASAAAVGAITGAGEAAGLVLRLATGPLADRTRRYWGFSIAGYVLTVVCVPLLALSGALWQAAGLVVGERFGKAVRTPARDALLSHATAAVGHGTGFGLHEALDQVGALAGPLVVALVLALGGGYSAAFAWLAIPAAATLAVLAALRRRAPEPAAYAPAAAPPVLDRDDLRRQSRAFWIYSVFTALTMAGFATFAVLAYHLQTRHVVRTSEIPLIYALAMGVDAVFAFGFGRLYDRVGFRGLVLVPLATAVVPWLSFASSPAAVWAGGALWGAAMGVHESTLRAGVADLSPADRRATAYGIFNAVYGLAWLGGSAAIGALYARSVGSARVFTLVMEALALVALAALLASRRSTELRA